MPFDPRICIMPHLRYKRERPKRMVHAPESRLCKIRTTVMVVPTSTLSQGLRCELLLEADWAQLVVNAIRMMQTYKAERKVGERPGE